MPSETDVLEQRALNRALLHRQLLLRRVDLPVGAALEHLVGLQAQAPLPPYYALWSRLESFDPHELGRLLTDREAVRLSLMRWTVHLVTVRDALLLRPLVQHVIERGFGTRRQVTGAARKRLERAVRELLDDGPLTERELGAKLVEHGIGEDVETIGRAARVYVPLVQIPPRGVWGESGRAAYATLESWTGRELELEPSIEKVVVRYLGAFGPASVADMQNWSRLTKLKQVFDRLRPQLVTFRSDDGRELFDLPEAPRPDPEVDAPVRFLGEFDNVLLGHADRRRIVPEDFPPAAMRAEGRFVSNLLVGGFLRGTWWIERDGRRRATLVIRPFRKLARAERDEVATEGERFAAFAAANAEARDLRFEAAVT